MSSKQGLSEKAILDIILQDVPSDYEEETDEEDEDEPLVRDPIGDCQMDSIALEEGAAVIIIGEDIHHEETPPTPECSANNRDINSLSQHDGKRKWKKKAEAAVNTEFSSDAMTAFDIESPMDAFKLFFDDTLMDRLHFETNLKSVQKGKPAEISKDEIKVFLGINMMMGYNHRPRLYQYWETHKDLEMDLMKSSMSRNRFQSILSNLHVNDNSKMDSQNRDKLYKIRPLLDHLNEKFIQSRQLSENLSIDESMILFKGRSTLKQYNPMKPIKRGYKLWCLADDSGYIYKLDVYTGKNTSSTDGASKKMGLGASVVLSLLTDIKKKNHKVYFDNFFSSIPLMETLQCKGILACGTIRSNRKDFPTLAADKDLKRGDFDYRSTPGGITVYKWADSKPVYLISNYHGITPSTVQRKTKDGTKVTVTCPTIVSDYNKHMGGVDKHDMLRKSYGTD